jgi:hypothetical protein
MDWNSLIRTLENVDVKQLEKEANQISKEEIKLINKDSKK